MINQVEIWQLRAVHIFEPATHLVQFRCCVSRHEFVGPLRTEAFAHLLPVGARLLEFLLERYEAVDRRTEEDDGDAPATGRDLHGVGELHDVHHVGFRYPLRVVDNDGIHMASLALAHQPCSSYLR